MLTLFQESVPFTNKRLEQKISEDGNFTNPVILPFAFNSTSSYNSLESVIYLRNDNPLKYYKGIVVSLMKEVSGVSNYATGVVRKDTDIYLSVPSTEDKLYLESVYEGFTFTSNIILRNSYKTNYVPISNDGDIEVKFSYGYDELSNYSWSNRKSGLYIPYLGNSTLFDMSYKPIRLKINFLSNPSLFTIRDYFIDISYSEELDVVGV